MKKTIYSPLGFAAIAAVSLVILQVSCTSNTTEKTNETQPEKKELSQTELVARGQYITTVSGCNDCHTPKTFGPQGPLFDSTRLMSGHPANDPIPPVDVKALQPGHWVLF